MTGQANTLLGRKMTNQKTVDYGVGMWLNTNTWTDNTFYTEYGQTLHYMAPYIF